MKTKPDATRLPDLGSRGEGWVILQVVLLSVTLGAGLLGPAWSGPARVAGALAGGSAMLGGIGLVAGGIVALRRQLTAYPRPVAGGQLIESGVFRLARHPMYGGGILVGLGWGLVTASIPALAGAVVLAVFFDLKSRREEAWLMEQFAGYIAYRQRTRRLIPWLY